MNKMMGIAAVLVLASCGDRLTGPPEEVDYVPELGVDLSAMQQTANGVYYLDVVTGTGDVAEADDFIHVTYTGWLVDGTEFDGGTTCFLLSSLIGGWKEGVPGMAVGGTRKLVIPPELAYGDRGSAGVPRNATIVFDIELHDLACP